MIMSAQDARSPENHDAPLEWRAPSRRGLRHLWPVLRPRLRRFEQRAEAQDVGLAAPLADDLDARRTINEDAGNKLERCVKEHEGRALFPGLGHRAQKLVDALTAE